MNTKRLLTLLLTAAMLFSLSVCGGTAYAELSDVDAQLGLIYSNLDTLKQNDGGTWYYTVADLNHNGCLEFIAAAQHKIDRSTNLRVWEVSQDRSALKECALDKDPEESFPDILTDSADTYHDPASDTWSYMFYDNIMLSPREVYTSKSAYHLKDGVVGYAAYAVEHTVSENGVRNVSHTDANGITISPEQYNAAGVEAFAGAERSNTSFDWIKAGDLSTLSRLADSYSVFTGRKALTEVFPVPKIQVVDQPAATAQPVPTMTPAQPAQNTQPLYLSVTKNPTNESKNEGGTALFVSCANAFESLTWTLVAPNGGEYSVANFRNAFPRANVSGEYSTTLTIGNVEKDMNNWGAYCTFYYKGQTARTSTAYMYVSGKAQPTTIPSGTYSGTVVDWTYSTVTLSIEGVNATISWDLCDVEGDLYYGAPAWVTWNGSNISYCYIKGSKAEPQPSYGAMSGTIYKDTASTVYVVLQNGAGLHLSAWLVNWISGSEFDGASCTVYYTGYPSEGSIYQIDVYGYDSQPDYGSMSGTAYEGGGGYAITLDNGTEVFADSWICNVSGTFVNGSRCTVYYTGYPSNSTIYSVDIYGSNDRGGWAGSQYWVYEQPVFDDGWAGSNYYDEGIYGYETDNYVDTVEGFLNTHVSYNYDGSTYEAVWCPYCGAEVSLAMEHCPVCGAALY